MAALWGVVPVGTAAARFASRRFRTWRQGRIGSDHRDEHRENSGLQPRSAGAHVAEMAKDGVKH